MFCVSNVLCWTFLISSSAWIGETPSTKNAQLFRKFNSKTAQNKEWQATISAGGGHVLRAGSMPFWIRFTSTKEQSDVPPKITGFVSLFRVEDGKYREIRTVTFAPKFARFALGEPYKEAYFFDDWSSDAPSTLFKGQPNIWESYLTDPTRMQDHKDEVGKYFAKFYLVDERSRSVFIVSKIPFSIFLSKAPQDIPWKKRKGDADQ